MKLSRAKSRLQSAGFHVKTSFKATDAKPAGTVLAQKPAAGKRLKPGATITLTVAKKLPPKYPAVNGNPWDYNWYCCRLIKDPPLEFCNYFDCIASFWDGRGYVIQCQDGEFSKSGGIQGSCSHHGGNRRYLYAP